ncbi:Uncharacterised protein [Mycobacterium tuberculosis]|nr:Uncharacterised protein [Mycobacterium tuberculosis]
MQVNVDVAGHTVIEKDMNSSMVTRGVLHVAQLDQDRRILG